MNHPLTITKILYSPQEYIEKFISIKKLTKTIENNSWHLNQPVLEHTMKVFNSVDQIISLGDPYLDLLQPIKQKIVEYMNSSIETNSRKSLLKISALFHDIGKVGTIKFDVNGITSCPKHALKSRQLLEKRAEILDLSQVEIKYVSKIIGKHHDADNFMDSKDSKQYAMELGKYRSANANIVIDLLFFYLFDFEGCEINDDIKLLKPSIYNKICGLISDEFKMNDNK